VALTTSRLDAASLLVIALTVVIGAALWPRLPPQIPIHFSATGTPGNYVSRLVAVLAMPIVMTGTVFVLKAVAWIDPPKSERAYGVIICSTLLLFLVVHLFTLGSSLGYPIPFAVLPVATAVWTVFVVGYTMRHEDVSL
jgi:uncharacterized membrane protein